MHNDNVEVLCGLTITTVNCTLGGLIKGFSCVDEQGQEHDIQLKDGYVLVDDLKMETTQKTYAAEVCALCRS